jgi:hypothetical protein
MALSHGDDFSKSRWIEILRNQSQVALAVRDTPRPPHRMCEDFLSGTWNQGLSLVVIAQEADWKVA